MQVESSQEQEFWYRPRLALEGYVIFRKEKNSEKCEVQDILILNSDGTTSAEPEPKSKSKKKSSKKPTKSTNESKSKTPIAKTPTAKSPIPSVSPDPNKTLNIARSKKSILNKDTLEIENHTKDLDCKEGSKVNEAIDLDRSESPLFSKKIDLVEKFTGPQDKSPIIDASKGTSGQSEKSTTPLPEKKLTQFSKANEKKAAVGIVEPIPIQAPSNNKKNLIKPCEEPQNPSINHSTREDFQNFSQTEMTFSCPDNRCSEKFVTSEELFIHMCNVHRLSCKMPYCSYMCYTFQEYSEHFEKIHCLAAPMPVKRPSSHFAQQAHKEFKQSVEATN
ncbi:hypothetical protein SteCoe_33815 [Stentor coeruleus]|uniref:C2H2-type domain-containing protein n=1 Tax=Stentor coeruleus TaxID=5963 RepID=A0A1R2AVX0_9CILI|nr:hypothetical protein SteCoe_33815 [Stentor coeruleus]